MLATFDRVLTALTFAVAGIAAVSLAVAGILIMNVMLIAVSQRTREIGPALAQEGQGEGVPPYVEEEFRRYLECGILAHGFARARLAGSAGTIS